MDNKAARILSAIVDRDWDRALWEAASSNYLISVVALLDEGADPNCVLHGSTALHEATDSVWRSSKIVGLLLEKGAVIDAKDRDGHTPLYHAIKKARYQQNDEVIFALLDGNAATGPEVTQNWPEAFREQLVHAIERNKIYKKLESKYKADDEMLAQRVREEARAKPAADVAMDSSSSGHSPAPM